MNYLVTFKTGDIHPFDKIQMYKYGVTVIAPDDEAMKIVVHARFGKAFHQVHISSKFDKKEIPKGIWETLIFQKPKK